MCFILSARAKVLYTSGKSSVKLAAVKIARIMCSYAVGNNIAMVFLQTTPSSGASKNSQSIFYNKLLLLQSEVKSYFRVGRDYRFRKRFTVHGVGAISNEWGLRGTFLLCCPLAKHTTRKEMFKNVDYFTKNSRTNCVSVCADGASAMIRTEKVLWIYLKGKQKY